MAPLPKHQAPPARVRTRRRELERQADAILRVARRRRAVEGRKRKSASSPISTGPRRFTLADLSELRRRGRVP
jgi:hypothetical protein